MYDKEFYDQLNITQTDMDLLITNWEQAITTDPIKGQMCAWSAYSYIARLVLPVLKIFMSHDKAGLPGGFRSNQEWNQVLYKITIAFAYIAYRRSTNKDEQKILKSIYKTHLGTEKPTLEEENQFSNTNVAEGCELFGKYFADLWD